MVLRTLNNLNASNNVGVCYEGYKGQGKSVQAKLLAIESGLPIILINCSIPKNYDFVSFLSSIKQDYVLLVDEFEKLFQDSDYRNANANESNFHDQGTFLSFLDGTSGFHHKRLVIFTTNKQINDKMIDRPTRIRYYRKYNMMKKEVFDSIIKDNLINKDFKQDLVENLSVANCTVDILVSIIEEINIQNKPYSQFKEYFNKIEKEVTYTRYIKEADGTFKYYDMVKSPRDIGPEDQYVRNIFGNVNVLSNDGETIIYSDQEWVVNPAYDENNPKKGIEEEILVNRIYKVIKENWTKRANFVF